MSDNNNVGASMAWTPADTTTADRSHVRVRRARLHGPTITGPTCIRIRLKRRLPAVAGPRSATVSAMLGWRPRAN